MCQNAQVGSPVVPKRLAVCPTQLGFCQRNRLRLAQMFGSVLSCLSSGVQAREGFTVPLAATSLSLSLFALPAFRRHGIIRLRLPSTATRASFRFPFFHHHHHHSVDSNEIVLDSWPSDLLLQSQVARSPAHLLA